MSTNPEIQNKPRTAQHSNDWMHAKELAEHFGVKYRTVTNWRQRWQKEESLTHQGKRKSAKGAPTRVYDPAKVEKWLTERDLMPKERKPERAIPKPKPAKKAAKKPKTEKAVKGVSYMDQLERAKQLEATYGQCLLEAIEEGNREDQLAFRKVWLEHAEHLRKMENGAASILHDAEILMPTETGERVLSELAAGIRAELRTLPTKLAPQLVNIDKPIEIKKKLQAGIDKVLLRLSEARIHDA